MASRLPPVDSNSRLTCEFFALNTGNVFSQSPRRPRSDCIARHSCFDTACHGCSSPGQKVSQVLRLACNECESTILSCRLHPCAEQKRLSAAEALRHRAAKQQSLPL